MKIKPSRSALLIKPGRSGLLSTGSNQLSDPSFNLLPAI